MKNLKIALKELQEEKPGLWANIRAKRARGEKPSHGNSKAHKDAVKAGNALKQEETKLSKDTLIVLSVIDGKRNLDNDQIRQLFDDNTAGTFYIYTNEEGEYENTKPVSRQDAYKYIDYYNARLKKDYKKEEKLGAELGVLGIESELQFKHGEFKTDPSIFSANENYKDGKVKDILSKYIDDYTEIDISVLNKLLKDKKKYPNELDPRTGGNKFGYRGMTFKKEFIDKLKPIRTSNGVTEYEAPSNIKVKSRSDKGYLSFTTDEQVAKGFGHYSGYVDHKKSPVRVGGYVRVSLDNPNFILHPDFTGELSKDLEYSKESEKETLLVGNSFTPDKIYVVDEKLYNENFADGKVKGKSRPGRVKKSGASCNGSVTDLRRKAKNASGEKAKMYHWCANMKSGRKK